MSAVTLVPCNEDGSEDSSRQRIKLCDESPVALGRNPLTGILDKKLSRQQLQVKPNFAKDLIEIEQLGSRASVANSQQLKKGDTHSLSHGQIMSLLAENYHYKVEFSPYETDDSKETPSNSDKIHSLKRKSEHLDKNENNTKKVKKSENKSLNSENEKKNDLEVMAVEMKLKLLQENAKKEAEKAKTSNKNVAVKKEVKNCTPPGEATKEEKWEELGKLVIYTSSGVRANSKIASFDIDGTIITTNSGKVFPQDINDWRINLPEIPGKLKQLHEYGYKVVFFTNQLGIGKGKLKLADYKKKLMNILRKFRSVPIQVFIATGSGLYRKPCTGMWDHHQKHCNDGITLNREKCFFVGDAAGRPADWAPKRKKDFSCSDRLFALNVGMKFSTPEEYFQGKKAAPYNLPSFDPRKLDANGPMFNPPSTQVSASCLEVLLLVGFPASGKSTFVKNHLLPHKYMHISRDSMGSWQKCVSACNAALNKGQSVVVDNTNPDLESRARYTECAKKAKVQCRCFIFNVTKEHAMHNERFRSITPAGKNHASIADMIFHSYNKKYQVPKKEEGFAEVAYVNFIPKFSDSEEEKLYRKFLMEK